MRTETGAIVNDIHSGLNPTAVSRVARVRSTADLQAAIAEARAEGRAVSICGGRHAMGGQQFGSHTVLIDTRELDDVLAFDRTRGLIEVEAGIQWPALLAWLERRQADGASRWTFRQKQTGADRLSIGGCLSANVHGRGLDLPPFVSEVESFTLVDANGELRRCSRTENAELFRLAIGGYGLFGAIATVTLRLVERHKVERVVEILDVRDLKHAFDERLAAGYEYGDFQFAIEPGSKEFLSHGVFSCYRRVPDSTPFPHGQTALSPHDWQRLIELAHVDKQAAFDRYAQFYVGTSGQVYWSDAHQMSMYLDDYHRDIDTLLGHAGSEMITEIYVPRDRLADFMGTTAADFRAHRVNVVYGTVRLIRRDDETFLPWAREDCACVIFNLHVEHSTEGLAHAAAAFRRLIDHAIRRRGSFYLTYHRWATRAQIEACYPGFKAFLERKRALDPDERFQSDWYRHMRALFAE